MKIGTKYYVVETGPETGQYCAYCASRLKPEIEEDTGEFTFKCVCPQAQKEFALISAHRVAETRLSDFYEDTAKETKMVFLKNVARALRIEAEQYERELKALEQ